MKLRIWLRPCPKYMDNHGHMQQPVHFIEPSMRTIAVSWLVEVGCEYCLQQETLFLATALLDRFLSNSKALPRNKLQLASVACMLIAAKHEEEMHPSVADFTNIADNCFEQSDLLRMESLVLQTLQFRINSPNAFTALSLFKQALRLSHKASALASFLTELSLLEYDLLQFQPSIIAASAILLAQRACGYCLAVLRECALQLRDLQQQAFDAVDIYTPFMAVKDKYRDIRRHCISHEAPLEALPPCLLL